LFAFLVMSGSFLGIVRNAAPSIGTCRIKWVHF